ncbi:MAG: hypothetical protein KAI66_17990, partial [Lentisphaeria bacterium]|nr:hypothetical protein [Lentisphaeria bacterium]
MNDKNTDHQITVRSLLVGALFAGVFAALTVVLENRRMMLPTANQIPLYPYILLVLSAVAINPLCRLVRVVRKFTAAELLIVFVMGAVSSGVSTFGLTGQVVPVIGSLFNRHWNNDQTEWNQYVEPYVNEGFFISEPGIRKAAAHYAEELEELSTLRVELDAATARDGSESSSAAKLATQIDRQRELVADALAALRKLESKAAEKVEVFRRGLPRGKRAFPGMLPTMDDNASGYFRRLGRLVHGKRSASSLRKAIAMLKKGEDTERVNALLREAATALAPSSTTTELEKTRESLSKAE